MAVAVTREDVHRFVGEGGQLVEFLPSEFEDEHLPGAINVPLKEIRGLANERRLSDLNGLRRPRRRLGQPRKRGVPCPSVPG